MQPLIGSAALNVFTSWSAFLSISGRDGSTKALACVSRFTKSLTFAKAAGALGFLSLNSHRLLWGNKLQYESPSALSPLRDQSASFQEKQLITAARFCCVAQIERRVKACKAVEQTAWQPDNIFLENNGNKEQWFSVNMQNSTQKR